MKRFFYTLALGLMFPYAAIAQETTEDAVDAELFKPAIGGGIFGVERAQVLESRKLYFGAFVNYARNPIVVFTQDSGEVFVVPVRDQSALDIVAAMGFGKERLELGFAIPTGLFMAGDNLDQLERARGDVQSGGLGDIRLNAKLGILRKSEDENGLRLSLLGEAKLPTGELVNTKETFFADKSPAFAATALADLHQNRLTLMSNFGIRVRTVPEVNIENTTIGNELIAAGGMEYKFTDRFIGDAELDALVDLQQNNTGKNNPGEARIGTKIGIGRFQIPLGVGAGINNSFSAPDFRIFTGITYVGESDSDKDGIVGSADACPKAAEDMDSFEDTDGCPESDNDGDMIVDKDDLCPNVAEDMDNFEDKDGCAEMDNDQDTISDASDSCPNDSEDMDGFQDNDGCPEMDNDQDGIADKDDLCPDMMGTTELKGCVDTDGDGVADNMDKCPSAAEDKDLFEDADGCPEADNDNDGFVDSVDFCPDQAEVKNGIKDNDGCPDEMSAVIFCGEIVILDKIFFDTNKTTLKSVSFPVLDSVAKIMKDHPEIAKVRVEGNADDRGPTSKNQVLSEGRANTVVSYLVSQGIDRDRLIAQGNTESKPLKPVDNLDPKSQKQELAAARDVNRRVEFFIVTE